MRPSATLRLRALLGLSLFALILAACAPAPQAAAPTSAPAATEAPAPTSAPAATEAPAPTSAPAATQAPAVETVTLSMGDWFESQSPAFERAIEEFQAANPTIIIERTVQNNFEELLPAAYQSGSAPDIVMVPPKPSLKEQVDAGWYLPWNDFADFEQFKASFPNADSAFIEGNNMFDGQVYSAPIEQPLPSLQLWINTDLFAEAGLVNADGTPQVPTTLDELAATAATITEQTGKYGFGLGNADGWRPIQFLLRLCVPSAPVNTPAGFFFDVKSGQYVAGSDPCLAKLAETLVSFREDQVINPDFQSLTDENIKAKFAEGEVAMIVGGSWLINGWKDTHPEFASYTAARMPQLTAGEQPYYWYSGTGGQFLAINANTAHPEAAWAFIKHIYSEQFGLAWAETGNGVNLFTPGDRAAFAENDAMKYILSSGDEMRVGPDPVVRNPAVSQIVTELQGPALPEVLTGILTGQITDIPGALADLDARSQQALELGIQDAQDAGLDVSLDDYIFSDWDPTQSYVTTPTE